MKIKKISLSELEELQKISVQTFVDTFSEQNSEEDMQNYISEKLNLDQLKSELENPNSEFYFAENNVGISGYLKLNFGDAQTEVQSQNSVEIERIYVSKEFLGLKVGQILFEKSLEIAEERKADFIWLGVWEENHRAIRFYEKNGFEVFGKHDFKLGNDVQTDLMMKLDFRNKN